jgi:hypothetical protein
VQRRIERRGPSEFGLTETPCLPTIRKVLTTMAAEQKQCATSEPQLRGSPLIEANAPVEQNARTLGDLEWQQ